MSTVQRPSPSARVRTRLPPHPLPPTFPPGAREQSPLQRADQEPPDEHPLHEQEKEQETKTEEELEEKDEAAAETGEDECPVGGEFGPDCDKYEDCDDCEVYDNCSDQNEILEKEKEKKKKDKPALKKKPIVRRGRK